MKIGYFLPAMLEGRRTPLGTVDAAGLIRRARAADQLGFHSIQVGEYVETTTDVTALDAGAAPNLFAPLTTMATVAAVTSRARIGSSVLIAPYHDPLVLGREIATLDRFSGGRVSLGLGLGGLAADFRRTRQRHPLDNRAAYMEELTEAMRRLWEDPVASYCGRYIGFCDVGYHPKPLQRPLPVLFAGAAEATLRRAARLGNGWIGVSNDPRGVPVSDTRSSINRIRGYLAEYGRPADGFAFTRNVAASIASDTGRAHEIAAAAAPAPGGSESGGGTRIVGNPELFRARLAQLEQDGLSEVCLTFYEPDLDTALHQLDLFATRVLPDFS